MSAQKKGPAEAATSPSHGSNNPQEGNAVNKQHDTTAPVSAATFDPIDYAERLYDLRMLARSAVMVVDGAFESALDHQGSVAITQYEADLISFIVSHVRQLVEVAETAFSTGAPVAGHIASPASDFTPSRPTSMRAAIERHKDTFSGLHRLYKIEAGASGKELLPAKMAVQAAEDQEGKAETALLRARPASFEEEADRLEYLFGSHGPWYASPPSEGDIADLVASLRAA